jgi:hypothetical protein
VGCLGDLDALQLPPTTNAGIVLGLAYWAKTERRAVDQLQPDFVKDWTPRG